MDMMRYTEPTVEVLAFETEDVICTSEPVVAEVPVLSDDIF